MWKIMLKSYSALPSPCACFKSNTMAALDLKKLRVDSLKYDNEGWSAGNRISSIKLKKEALQLNLKWWDKCNQLCKCEIRLHLLCIISHVLGPQILFYWDHFECFKSPSTCQTPVCLFYFPFKKSQLQKTRVLFLHHITFILVWAPNITM